MWSNVVHYYLLFVTNLSGHNLRPKLRFRRTSTDLRRASSDDRQLFAALRKDGVMTIDKFISWRVLAY